MKLSPKVPAMIYLLMALVFFYAATRSVINATTLWNTTTILLAIVTTFMLGASIRLFKLHFLIKKHTKKK